MPRSHGVTVSKTEDAISGKKVRPVVMRIFAAWDRFIFVLIAKLHQLLKTDSQVHSRK